MSVSGIQRKIIRGRKFENLGAYRLQFCTQYLMLLLRFHEIGYVAKAEFLPAR